MKDVKKKLLVTGGSGFIGSCFVRNVITETQHSVLNIDSLTYAGNMQNLSSVDANARYTFEKADICDRGTIKSLLTKFEPDIVINFAAESHVDRSINEPAAFITTNIVGSYCLLEEVREYWQRLHKKKARTFKFIHVSTDEVFGDLEVDDEPFSETTPYAPNSPYSASKASSDHLVRSWCTTFGLPTIITNCSNNYGPFQYPEKLLPLVINNALKGKSIPVYGSGLQVRDWLYVEDHVAALFAVINFGKIGDTYCIGSRNEIRNIDLIGKVCEILDRKIQHKFTHFTKHSELIVFVEDRLGHDQRYSINPRKIEKELGWQSSVEFDYGLEKTVEWYIANQNWVNDVCKKVH